MQKHIECVKYGIEDIHLKSYETLDKEDRQDFVKLFAIMYRHIDLPKVMIPQPVLSLLNTYLDTVIKIDGVVNMSDTITIQNYSNAAMHKCMCDKLTLLSFMDAFIKQYIRAHDNIETHIDYKFNNIAIKIVIYDSVHHTADSLHNIIHVKLLLCIVCFYIASFTTQPTIDKVVVNLFMTPFKKHSPLEPHHSIKPININSGSCHFRGGQAFEINLWRQEELYKVLCHELCHYFKIDNIDQSYYDFKTLFNIEGDVKPREAMTEMNGILIHHLHAAYHFNPNKNNVIQNLCNLVEIDTCHSILNVAKILKHFGCDSFQDFKRGSSRTLRQDTSVFSYYILKSALLCNFQQYLLFLESATPIHGGVNWDGITKDFFELSSTSLSDENFIRHINQVCQWMKKKKLKHSLRMSCVNMIFK